MRKLRKIMRIACWSFTIALLFASLAPSAPIRARVDSTPANTDVFAFVNVQVIPMDAEHILPGQTIIVRDGIIAEIGSSDSIRIPADAQVIDGGGRYLLPGLIDMHVHIKVADLPVYVANGITTVRNMWGWPGLPGVIDRVNRGEVIGPTIYSASPGLDDNPPQWPFTRIVSNASEAESAVEDQIRAGWQFIKVYQSLRFDVYSAILAAARARNIPVVGHVATRVNVKDALSAGQASIEHLTGYDAWLNPQGRIGTFGWINVRQSKMRKIAKITRKKGAWNCPTLAIYTILAERFHSSPSDREAIRNNRRLMVGALHDAGAKLLAGTDSGIDATAPGSSIRDELSEMVASGLTPFESLAAATRDAAQFLGKSNEIGTIAAGKRADLLFVESNPLQDINALASIVGVMTRGKWYQSQSGATDLLKQMSKPPISLLQNDMHMNRRTGKGKADLCWLEHIGPSKIALKSRKT